MEKERLRNFIETYNKYYYNDHSQEEKNYGKEHLGVTIIHPTDREDEDKIEAMLRSRKQSAETIAWKMGVSVGEEGIKTQYHEYPIENIEEYCRILNEKSIWPITKNR